MSFTEEQWKVKCSGKEDHEFSFGCVEPEVSFRQCQVNNWIWVSEDMYAHCGRPKPYRALIATSGFRSYSTLY